MIDKNGKGEWTFLDELKEDIKKKKMVLLQSQEVTLAEGQGHHLTLSYVTDLVVFYEGVSHKHP